MIRTNKKSVSAFSIVSVLNDGDAYACFASTGRLIFLGATGGEGVTPSSLGGASSIAIRSSFFFPDIPTIPFSLQSCLRLVIVIFL